MSWTKLMESSFIVSVPRYKLLIRFISMQESFPTHLASFWVGDIGLHIGILAFVTKRTEPT